MRGPREKGGRKQKRAAGSQSESGISADEVSLVRACGLRGNNRLETEEKLGRPLTENQLIAAYIVGKADHAYTVMGAIYERALAGSDKLLIWLAENSLKRSQEQDTGDALFEAMTPDQRREEIRKLTKKLKIA